MTIKDYFSSHLSTGRIREIRSAACRFFGVSSPSLLTATQKLSALCTALCIDAASLDDMIANSPEVLRTVKGHAFEIIFEKMMFDNHIACYDAGGDSDVDLIVNDFSLQLKTPYVNGCSDGIVSYKTHKTHGAKSVRESMDYYHKVSDFADFLIGLVSYEPFIVVIIPKGELPRVPEHTEYIISPMYISLNNGNYINAFHRIGITSPIYVPTQITTISSHETLPKSASAVGIKSEYILEAIFRVQNFRIWDMNIRGFIREKSFHHILLSRNITLFPPTITGLERPEKSDFVLQACNGSYIRFQIKGLTFSGCRFHGQNLRIDCETQLSRGRVNDHPTQSRLYKTSDFDYLIMAVDPPYSNVFSMEYYGFPDYSWTFYCVPVSALCTHPVYTNRISSHQYMMYSDIQQYKITECWFTQWRSCF